MPYLPPVVFDGQFDTVLDPAALEREPWYSLMPTHTQAELDRLQDAGLWPTASPPSHLATTCPICGRRKARLTVCQECRGILGDRAPLMPTWAREAVNYARRERYNVGRWHAGTSSLGDFESAQELQEWLDSKKREHLRLPGEYVKSRGADDYGALFLPFAPYPDEATNRLYRKANGIRPIRAPEPPTTTAQDATGAAIAEHKPKSRHYDAHNPNLPAGWWGSGSWLRQGRGPAEVLSPAPFRLEDIPEILASEDRELAAQVMREAQAVMTERQYTCLVLWLLGLTQAAIGRRLGISVKTAHEHCHKGLEIARAIAAKTLETDPT